MMRGDQKRTAILGAEEAKGSLTETDKAVCDRRQRQKAGQRCGHVSSGEKPLFRGTKRHAMANKPRYWDGGRETKKEQSKKKSFGLSPS